MQITDHIHALRISFKVPITPELSLDRFVYVYLIFGKNIYLIDSGVAGSSNIIFAYIQEQGRKPEEISDPRSPGSYRRGQAHQGDDQLRRAYPRRGSRLD